MGNIKIKDKNKLKSRFAEGALNGMIFSAVYGVLAAPYYSKEATLASTRSFRYEYMMHNVKAFPFYMMFFGFLFAITEVKSQTS